MNVQHTAAVSAQQRNAWTRYREAGLPNSLALLRIAGPLQGSVVHESLRRLLLESEFLRTRFADDGRGQLTILRVDKESDYSFRFHDLSRFDPTAAEPCIAAIWQAGLAGGIDLRMGPLLAADLICVNDLDWRLLLRTPVLSADRAAICLFALEVGRRLTGLGPGAAFSEACRLPYDRYAEWQNSLADSGELTEGRQFWATQLDVGLAPRLPFANSASGRQVGLDSISVALPESVSGAIAALASGAPLDPEALPLAAWAELIRRHTERSDFVVARHSFGHHGSHTGPLLGPLSRALPTIVRLDQSLRVADLAVILESAIEETEYWREYLPVVTERFSPEWPIHFEFHREFGPMAGCGLDVQLERTGSTSEPFGMNLVVTERGHTKDWTIHYDRNAFPGAYVQNIAEQLAIVATQIAAGLDRTLGALSFASDRHCQQVLHNRNTNVRLIEGASAPFHQRFAEEAARTPHAIAAVCGASVITYGELNTQANQVANLLLSAGVPPGALIGLFMKRTPDLLAALLGALKAGCAYVPLDPLTPSHRICRILQRASVTIVLTSADLENDLQQSGCRSVLAEASALAGSPKSSPEIPCDLDDRAYVIFTSGSTGEPKGVVATHRGLANYLAWAVDYYGIRAGLDGIVHSSISFDATITSLLAPLLAGRKVILVPQESELDDLGALLEITGNAYLIKITPTHLDILATARPDLIVRRGGNTFVIGGEALSGRTLRFWMEKAPYCRFINEYGPTETVVGCSYYEIDSLTPLDRPIPIGHAIANCQIYVLTDRWEPAPVGVPGELFVGGPGVAEGYLGDPALTASRFVPDPFDRQDGRRLYRTGDWARYRPDGAIEFLGRRDEQVKIRGNRVELAEVDAVLHEHPAVEAAAVTTHGEAAAC